MTSDSNCNIIEHLNRDFEKWQEKDNSDLIYLLEVNIHMSTSRLKRFPLPAFWNIS